MEKNINFLKTAFLIRNFIKFVLFLRSCSDAILSRLDIEIINAMLKNAVQLKNQNFVIEVLRACKQRNIEPNQETINKVMAHHGEIAKLLKELHSMSRHERNDCFKYLREIKQYLKHFDIREHEGERDEEHERDDMDNKV